MIPVRRTKRFVFVIALVVSFFVFGITSVDDVLEFASFGLIALCVTVLFYRDSSEQKQSEIVLGKLSSAVEQGADLVLITDRQGCIEYVNPAFVETTGYSRDEALGRTPRLLKSGQHDRDFYQKLWDTVLAGQVFRAEMVNRKKSGELYFEEKSIVPLKDSHGNITHLVSTSKNVTERVQARQLLQQKLDQRTRDLSTLYDLSARAVQELDLRTILTQSLGLVFDAMRASFGEIRLLDETEKDRVLKVSQGIPEEAYQVSDPMSLREGPSSWVFANDPPLVTPDLAEDPRLSRVTARSFPVAGHKAYASVTIAVRRNVIGTLSLLRESTQPFREDEIALLTLIGNQLGVIVENARLQDKARVQAVQDERERLSLELHDSVTQTLFGLSLLAETVRRFSLTGKGDLEQYYLGRMGETAQQALKETRLLVYALRPEEFETAGLVGALQLRIDAVENRAGVKASLVTEGILDLPQTTEEALYRVALEALNNSLKHAVASWVTVQIHALDGYVQVVVEDDGKGFCPDAVKTIRGGMGLGNMRKRMERLGGSLEIVSTPGQGTRVKARVQVGEPKTRLEVNLETGRQVDE